MEIAPEPIAVITLQLPGELYNKKALIFMYIAFFFFCIPVFRRIASGQTGITLLETVALLMRFVSAA